MRETFEFRINEKLASRLSRPNAGRSLGDQVRQLYVSADDPLFAEIGAVDAQLRATEGRHLFTYWRVRRDYTAAELKSAELFRFLISTVFEPAGEECGTQYDDERVCKICGAGADQISELFLDLRKVPRTKEIACTIAGECIVSQRLAQVLTSEEITGVEFRPVRHRGNYASDAVPLGTTPSGRKLIERARHDGISLNSVSKAYFLWISQRDVRELWDSASREYVMRRQAQGRVATPIWPKWYQLWITSARVSIVPPTRAGVDPFDPDVKGRCRCPRGDNIGHTLTSEIWVSRKSWDGADVALTKETMGPRRGLLRPRPEMLVSPRLRSTLLEHRIKGVEFEIAHLV